MLRRLYIPVMQRTTVSGESPHHTCHAPAWQEGDRATVPTVSPDEPGLCGAIWCPARRGRVVLCWPGGTSGLGPGGTLSFAGGVSGVHGLRAGGPGRTIGRAMNTASTVAFGSLEQVQAMAVQSYDPAIRW